MELGADCPGGINQEIALAYDGEAESDIVEVAEADALENADNIALLKVENSKADTRSPATHTSTTMIHSLPPVVAEKWTTGRRYHESTNSTQAICIPCRTVLLSTNPQRQAKPLQALLLLNTWA